MTRLVLCIGITQVLLAAALGCSRAPATRPSVLVIAVDRLGYGMVSCREEARATDSERQSGFVDICRESVRFTHAYSTSTLTVPALASVLTGLFPFESGVRSNGRDSLSFAQKTVAEQAQDQGFSTMMVSGGPPVLRKSGLHQGFDEFRDHFPVSGRFPLRPARDVFDDIAVWLSERDRSKPVFAVAYLSDLLFPKRPTKDELGVLREASLEGQIEEIDHQLGRFLKRLKEMGRFEPSHIVLVGLTGGLSPSRPGELPPLNLFSEGTHVTLMLKPARKPRDAALSWQIDSNVSLADLGPTLQELLGVSVSPPSLPFPNTSLAGLFQHPTPKWSEDRAILTESAWADWYKVGGVRAAIRFGVNFFIHDERPLLFNTLTDNLEVAPLDTKIERHRFLVGRAQSQLEVIGIKPFRWYESSAGVDLQAALARTDLSAAEVGLFLEQRWFDAGFAASIRRSEGVLDSGRADLGPCGSLETLGTAARPTLERTAVKSECWSEATQALFEALGLVNSADATWASQRWESERLAQAWLELNAQQFWIWSMRSGPGRGRDPVFFWTQLPWVRRQARGMGLSL
jgi:hypothetical protein